MQFVFPHEMDEDFNRERVREKHGFCEGLHMEGGGAGFTFVWMKYETYGIIYDHHFSMADFESTGRFGIIKKRVAFIPTNIPGVFNLTYGDIKGDGKIDDLSISDNGDRNKLLATIAKVVIEYTARYPHRYIYFRGSSNARTRLYRMAITLHLKELSQLFEIYAETEHNPALVKFYKTVKATAFVIKRKIT